MSIQVQPKEIITIQHIHSFNIYVGLLNLGSDANINVSFYDVDGVCIKSEGFVLSQPEYDLWVSDEWLVEYVANKYGLVIKN